MSDPLTDWLKNDTTSSRYASLDAEDMERLGKEAALGWDKNHIPLSESVTKLAAAYPDINSEQIKRICEFANQSTYLLIHERNKVAGATTSYPKFPLADAGKVIQDLSDGARPTVIDTTDRDYAQAPYRDPMRKTAQAKVAKDDATLEAVFGAAHEEPESRDSVVHETVILRDKLAGVLDHLKASGEQIDLHRQGAEEEYYQTVKQHVMEGNSFGEVLHAAHALQIPKEKIASVLQPVVGRLMREKIATPMALAAGTQDLKKLAHRVLDTSHPLVTLFGAVVDLQTEVKVASIAIKDTEQQLDQVKDFMRQELR